MWPQVGRGRPETSLLEDVWEHSSAPRDRAVFRRPQLCKASSCGAFCILDRLRGAIATFVSMIFSCSLGRKLDHFLGFRNSAQELRRSSQARSKQRAARSNQRAPGVPKQHGSSPGTTQKHPRYDTMVPHIGALFSQVWGPRRSPAAQSFPP